MQEDENPNTNWPYPGARWWKFDFHTHTPASQDTGAWQAVIGSADELKPETWLQKYMEAGIDCVAITDHNNGEWIDRLKAAYATMKQAADAGNPASGFRELYLFPGVEISVNGGFHLLAIFDTSATSQTISDLLAKAGYQGTRGNSDDVTQEAGASVVKGVLAAGGIPIPAHVDCAKGLLELQENGKTTIDATTVRQVLQQAGLLALEWRDPQAAQPHLLRELKLNFASVVGSDCHSFRGEAVPGSRYTWIKMASPSIEGLRLALLDGQDVSVRRWDDADGFQPNRIPEHFIESIQIKDARYMGRGTKPALLKFNPYFNALIGGRGTGKSTVVHALRLAYRRETELAAGTEAMQTFERFNKVARSRADEGGLQTDTHICLQLNRDGIRYQLLWLQNANGPVVKKWDDSTAAFKPSGSQVISPQRFPLRLFSQGQIAALAGDSQQSLLKVIDDAAGTATQQAGFEAAKRAFFSTRAQLRELKSQLAAREALKVQLEDVQRKLARFEVADHAVVLKNFQRTNRQSREVDRQFQSASELASRLKDTAVELLAEDLPHGLFDPMADQAVLQVMGQLHEAISSLRIRVQSAVTDFETQCSTWQAEWRSSDWSAQVGQAKAAYDQLKSDLQQQGVNDPAEYGKLVQEKQHLETELKRLDALHTKHIEQQDKAKAQFAEVKNARQTISQRRQHFLQTTLEGNPYVRMELVPYSRDARTIDRSLREILGTSEGTFEDDLYGEPKDGGAKGAVADLLAAVQITDSPGAWATAEFESSLQMLKKRLSAAATSTGDFGARFNKFLKGEAQKRPELLDDIHCWFPEDGLQVEYSRKGNGKDFQSIGQASAGQRAAAMLAFLLAQGGEPLVLDQPEDDLDNHLIYSLVVQQIRSNKLRRQLIIVTHNPNIVVNGDAELIHVLDFNSQCFVKQSGSLQDLKIRSEVCLVMEGGKEAFERRYQRLGKED